MKTAETSSRPKKPTKSRQGKKKILRAKPVTGPIDWAELSRETIARYPNILKRLAES